MHFGFSLTEAENSPLGGMLRKENHDSLVSFGPAASTFAFDLASQDFGICRYDTIIQALVEL